MRYFFYGTLRDPDVRRAVIGPAVDRVRIVPGILPGYRCVFMRGRYYPALRLAPQAEVEGVIADGIDSFQAARIDRFETSEYRLRKAAVRSEDGTESEALVYFTARPGLAGTTPWRLDDWQRRHKPAALRAWFKL